MKASMDLPPCHLVTGCAWSLITFLICLRLYTLLSEYVCATVSCQVVHERVGKLRGGSVGRWRYRMLELLSQLKRFSLQNG